MADGNSLEIPRRATSDEMFGKLAHHAARRANADAPRTGRAVVGGFEKPRAQAARPLDSYARVATFGEERVRPEREVQDSSVARDASVSWMGWMQDLSKWMKEARIKRDLGFTDQLWQNYAHRFPASEQLLLNGPEKDRWDECLTEFFYANPVLQRVYDALEAKRHGRFSPEQGQQMELLRHQLGDLKHHLQALDRASFRGYIPQAEQTIIDLERRFEQERGMELEMRVRRQMATEKGEVVPPRMQDQVVSEHRQKRISEEYSAKHVREELKKAKEHLTRAASHFRESLLTQGVPEKDIPSISFNIARGDFSALDSLGSGWGRMKETFRVGGFLRGLGSAVGLSKSALKERAEAFREASKNMDVWQERNDQHRAQDREVLKREGWIS